MNRQRQTVEITPAKGRPFLHWVGKKPLERVTAFPAQVVETFNPIAESGEGNLLFHGDNKEMLAYLLANGYRGKVNLIYIDPPFATGQDFSYRARVGDEGWVKEASIIEETAYRDTWGRGLDSYLQMMYERLVLMRELLTETGSIYVHCDYRVNSHLRLLLDEVFGASNLRNEVVSRRQTKSLQKQFKSVRTMNVFHDTIFWYSKQTTARFSGAVKNASVNQQQESWPSMWNNVDRPTMRYPLLGVTIERGQWKWRQERAIAAVTNYEEYAKHHSQQKTLIEYWEETGRTKEFIRRKGVGYPEYWIPPRETVLADTNWLDIQGYSYSTGYDTEKSEALLERIIKASSNDGDLVADFFSGSGTTMAVAEKLGRRWIGCDLSRYAIQVSRKRMLDISDCKPFQVLNLGKYERKHWQVNVLNGHQKDGQKAIADYLRFIVSLYHADPLTGLGGYKHLHGQKAGRWVHVGAADALVTRAEIIEAIRECQANRYTGLDVLGWEWEMGLHDTIRDEAKRMGVDLRLLYIPREVMDTRAVKAGDVHFYELAYLKISLLQDRRTAIVRLEDFIIPNPDLVPDEVRSKVKRWSDYIDFWAVDWEYQGDTFHNQWQTYRTRKSPTLRLVSDPYTYERAGSYKVLVKVIDIFGNDTTQLLEVAVP